MVSNRFQRYKLRISRRLRSRELIRLTLLKTPAYWVGRARAILAASKQRNIWIENAVCIPVFMKFLYSVLSWVANLSWPVFDLLCFEWITTRRRYSYRRSSWVDKPAKSPSSMCMETPICCLISARRPHKNISWWAQMILARWLRIW